MKTSSIIKHITAVLALACAGTATAASNNNVCLHLADSSRVYFHFENKPTLTFSDNKIQISDTKNKTAVYNHGNLHKITFEDNSSVAHSAVAAKGSIIIDPATRSITFSGFEPHATVSVVTASGIVVLHATLDSSGELTTSLPHTSAGNIYIATAAGVPALKFSL